KIAARPVIAPEEWRSRFDQHAVLAQIACELVGIHTFRPFDPECSATKGRLASDFQSFAIKGVDHDDMALVIFNPHTVDNRIIMAKRQKVCCRSLQMTGRMAQHKCAQCPRLTDDRRWRNQIAKPKSRKQ